MQPLFSLLVLLLLPTPSCLYSLHNCSFDFDEQIIDCSWCELPRIPPDIPRSALNLSVYNNEIHRLTVSDFHGLGELQMLDLGKNHISFIEDAAFSHLSSLVELTLSSNGLTNLTELMFTGLSNLTILELKLNLITSISESAFASLSKLQRLDLSENLLYRCSDVVRAVWMCPSIRALALSGNPLTTLESEQFPLNITDLDLSHTPLYKFMLQSDVLPRLESLSLSSIVTDLQWNVSDKAFLRSLRTLGLGSTTFSDETYWSILQSVDSLENLGLRDVVLLDDDLLDWACDIQTLQMLDLSSNHISDLLLPCSNLTELDLSQNPMLDLALTSLTHLSRLFVVANRLRKVPEFIRNMSSLTSLLVGSNQIRELGCWDFSGLFQLTVLGLNDNQLSELRSCVFDDLHSLHTLYIEQNFINSLDGSFGASVSNLQLIVAWQNNIARLDKGIFRHLSHVTDLQLQSDRGTVLGDRAFDGLTALTTLSYSPSLSYFTAAGGPGVGLVFNLPALQTLSLTVPRSNCYFWPQDFLRGLDALEELLLHHCFCVDPDPETFCYTPRLLNLEIRENENWVPVPQLFQPLTALQTLDLSENHLTSLDFLSEANLTQLQTLILIKNDLSVINVHVLDSLPLLRYLDLAGNPFACNCSNADFINWAIWNTQVYFFKAFRYRCASPPSHQEALLLEFDARWCWEYVAVLCFICSSSLVLLTLLPTFIHHFLRLHLLYGFYLLRAFLYHRQQRKRGCAEIYDAFVSYNVHDEEWVYRELLPELEGRQGWKLCLHHRNFEPGKAILENITDAIYSSRKTLCVISRHYLLSEWCSREIQMASFRLLDVHKDVLILLFLEELSPDQLSPFFRMKKLLSSRTYLSWGGPRGHRGLFWERVRRALQQGSELTTEV